MCCLIQEVKEMKKQGRIQATLILTNTCFQYLLSLSRLLHRIKKFSSKMQSSCWNNETLLQWTEDPGRQGKSRGRCLLRRWGRLAGLLVPVTWALLRPSHCFLEVRRWVHPRCFLLTNNYDLFVFQFLVKNTATTALPTT